MTDQPQDYGEPWVAFEGDIMVAPLIHGYGPLIASCNFDEKRFGKQTDGFTTASARRAHRICKCVNEFAAVPDPAGLMREVRIVIEDLIRVIATTPDPPGMGDIEALAVYKARTLLARLPKETDTKQR